MSVHTMMIPCGVRLRTALLGTALLGTALLAMPPRASADPGAAGPNAGNCAQGFHDGPPHPPGPPMGMGHGFGPPGGDFDEARPPPFLMGLKLTEDQQDKIFAIVHAAAPALRDESKAVHKAHGALMELVSAADFSDATATTLAQSQGKAESQLTLLRTRMEHQIYAVLTTEQRTQISQRRQAWESHRDPHQGEGPPPR